MSLFDRLVDESLRARADLASLTPAVEKMSAAGLLAGFTLIGGTCLRACYGASRLSQGLDFTGGRSTHVC